jgi:hypothetical protein
LREQRAAEKFQSIREAAMAKARAEYRTPSAAELLGIAVIVFFIAAGFAGCSILFPPLLLISVPAVVAAPIAAFVVLRKQISGPCPYCGAEAGPARKPFDCRACGRRVLIADGAFVRVVHKVEPPPVTPH